MKRFYLCIFAFLFSVDILTAQDTNNLVKLLENAVIEYYDTLSNSSVHRVYILQKFRRGKLCDTNFYLYADNINIKSFLLNLQKPDKMPSKAFYHNGKHYSFIERTLTFKTVSWTYCKSPKINKNNEVQVIEISNIDLHSDTLVIRLSLCYLSKKRILYKGRLLRTFVFSVSDGVIFEYVFSKTTQDWVCVRRSFWGI